MLHLIEGGEVFAPESLGRQSILTSEDKVIKIGNITESVVDALGVEYEVTDATGKVVLPGLVDPHEHLIGAGGESGFGSREPEISAGQIMLAGITTVVGCLGTDTVTRHLTSLLAKTRQIETTGLTAFMLTGGYTVPPPYLTTGVTEDLIIVDKVIGVGEIAISDARSTEPSREELARIVSGATIGRLLSGKAGVVHFHVGNGESRLSILHDMLDQNEVDPTLLYPTHIGRSLELIDEAIALARRGSFVDTDCVDEDSVSCIQNYLNRGGDTKRFSISSDSGTKGGCPAKFIETFRASVHELGLPLELAIRLFSSNASKALNLNSKGRIEVGLDADLLIMDKGSLELKELFARGRHVVKEGEIAYGSL